MFGVRQSVRISNATSGRGSEPTASSARVLFRDRDFRAFWIGALVSNVGTWMQNVSVPYALFQLTGEARWVGTAAVAQFLPSIVAGPLGGAIADRVDRKRFLLVSQLIQCSIAVTLWLAWSADVAGPGVLVGLLAINGVVYGGTAPGWQAFVGELAPPGTLVSAITLNSAQLNAARAVGPALAGVVIAQWGVGTAFLANAVSYSGVIVALVIVRRAAAPATTASPIWDALRTGSRYVVRQAHLRAALVTALVTATLLAPLHQFLAVVADDVGATSAGWYGAMTAAYGFGASFGAIALATAGSRLRASTVLRWSLPVYAVLVAGLSQARAGWQCVVVLPLIGAAFVNVFSVLNTAVQRTTPAHLRGRVLSFYLATHSIGVPAGSWVQGVAADRFGVQRTLLVAASVHLLFTLACARRLLARLDAGPGDAPTEPVEPTGDRPSTPAGTSYSPSP